MCFSQHTGNVLPHHKQGKWSSLLVYSLFRNTKYIFCETFSPAKMSLRKVLKEIHNVVVSHLLTSAVFRVTALQCKTLNKSCLLSHTTLKEENKTSEWQWIWHSNANPVEPRLAVHRSSLFLHGLFLDELHYIWRYLEKVVYCSASRLFRWVKGFFPFLSWTHVHSRLVSQYKQTQIQIWSQLFEIYFLPLHWFILWITLWASAEHLEHQPDTYKNINHQSHLELQKLFALSCRLR